MKARQSHLDLSLMTWYVQASLFFYLLLQSDVTDEDRKRGYLYNEITSAAWKFPTPEEKGVLV